MAVGAAVGLGVAVAEVIPACTIHVSGLGFHQAPCVTHVPNVAVVVVMVLVVMVDSCGEMFYKKN